MLKETFPPVTDRRVPIGDVFTSCNWVIRDGSVHCAPGSIYIECTETHCLCRAPKTATKRIFLITDEDDPHPGASGTRLMTSARTTLIVCEYLEWRTYELLRAAWLGPHTSRRDRGAVLHKHRREGVRSHEVLLCKFRYLHRGMWRILTACPCLAVRAPSNEHHGLGQHHRRGLGVHSSGIYLH